MSTNILDQFSDKKVAILGFGIEGQIAAQFFLKYRANVHVFDRAEEADFDKDILKALQKNGVEFTLGKLESLQGFDLIVRSPGIPLHNPVLQDALSRGQEVTSVTRLFFDLCPCPIIGVTGTKGKGTTSTLIYEMLKQQGIDAYLGGNIGVPALSLLEQLTPESQVVLELSSFQLVDLHKSPHIAVMLMVTSEHLDYHKDVMEYVSAKRNILAHQTSSDFAVINKDYLASRESDVHTLGTVYFMSREQEVEAGAFIRDSAVWIRMNDAETKIIDTDAIMLPGQHNWENVMASVMAALLAGVDRKHIVQVLKVFKGLEHRLELVRIVGGVRYYDDSFSTTPETAAAAIESFEAPEILILGGSSKNSDFHRLGQVIGDAENIKAIIGIGVEWKKIKSQIRNPKFEIIEGLKNMSEIVKKASELAEPGDIVLLSPACASFDMFKNYKERGNQFKEEVSQL